MIDAPAVLKPELDRPLYLQLVDWLREDIAGKQPGDRVDSEPKLAERFGVSRFTVTRAIEILVDEGLIRRRQGLGSFVAPPPLRRAPSYLCSFTDAIAAQGRAATHRLLAFGPAAWREGLPYDQAEALVRMDRLRLVDRVPTAIHRSVVAAALAKRIGLTRKLAAAPGCSLYRMFRDAGLVVARGDEKLWARSATAEEAELLQLGDDSVVMEVTRNTYDSSGTLLDAVDAVYDARRYTYQAEIRSDLAETASPEKKMEVGYANRNDRRDFGPRLGPWSDDGDGGGKADGAHHRARRTRRPVV
jgi:GntR family transcriptional regulator